MDDEIKKSVKEERALRRMIVACEGDVSEVHRRWVKSTGEVITRQGVADRIARFDLDTLARQLAAKRKGGLRRTPHAHSAAEGKRIRKALRVAGGDRLAAAKALKMSPVTLWRRMRYYKIPTAPA